MKTLPHILIGMLLWALLPFNPYAYYQLLRVILFFALGYMALRLGNSEKHKNICIALAVLAVIYNPFLSLHLGRALWSLLNIATAAFLFFVTPALDARKAD